MVRLHSQTRIIQNYTYYNICRHRETLILVWILQSSVLVCITFQNNVLNINDAVTCNFSFYVFRAQSCMHSSICSLRVAFFVWLYNLQFRVIFVSPCSMYSDKRFGNEEVVVSGLALFGVKLLQSCLVTNNIKYASLRNNIK